MKTYATNHLSSINTARYVKSKVQYIKDMDRTSLMFKAFNGVNRSEMARMSTPKFAPKVLREKFFNSKIRRNIAIIGKTGEDVAYSVTKELLKLDRAVFSGKLAAIKAEKAIEDARPTLKMNVGNYNRSFSVKKAGKRKKGWERPYKFHK